jgi:cell volume regulation protein A
VPESHLGGTISQFMVHRLGGTAEVGDRVSCGDVDLVVREVDPRGEIAAVGLAIDQRERHAQLPLFLSGEEIWRWLRHKMNGHRSKQK